MSSPQNSNPSGSLQPSTPLSSKVTPTSITATPTNLQSATITPMAAPPSIPIHNRSSLSARRLSESRPGLSGPIRGLIGVSTSTPIVQHWNVPVSPNLSEAGGRAPSVSSALVDMEQEQEAQVNRLLGVIHWLQGYIADLQRSLAAETGDLSANVSVALEDVLPRIGRHPSATPRPVSASRQSSVSSYRGGGRGQTQNIGIAPSPSLQAQSMASAPLMEALPSSHGSIASEGVYLRRENEMLKARIRELERHVKTLQNTVNLKESVIQPPVNSLAEEDLADEDVIPSIETEATAP